MGEVEMIDDQKTEMLWERLQSLDAENKRLRAELDWVREKFLEAETKLWFDERATSRWPQ